MLNKIKSEYRQKIKKKFLKYKDILSVDAEIQSLGYTTTRYPQYYNINRLSAVDKDKNKIEFILSNKNMYIIINTSCSNEEKDETYIYSTNKEFKSKDMSFIYLTRFKHDRIKNNSNRLNKLSPEKLYVNNKKSNIFNKFKDSMGIQYTFSAIREYIFYLELEDLPKLSDVINEKQVLEALSKKLLLISIPHPYQLDRLYERKEEIKRIKRHSLPNSSYVKELDSLTKEEEENLIKSVSMNDLDFIKKHKNLYSSMMEIINEEIRITNERLLADYPFINKKELYVKLFYKDIFNKYTFNYNDLYSILINKVMPYTIKNKERLIKEINKELPFNNIRDSQDSKDYYYDVIIKRVLPLLTKEKYKYILTMLEKI